MKRIVFSALLAVLIAGVGSCQAGADREAAAPVLSKADFQDKLSSMPGVQLVDVRTPEEFGEGHLEGAVNIDFLDDEVFSAGIKGLDKERPVLLYCRSGRRSADAGRLLLKEGFKEVYDLEGGYLNWTE